VWDPKIFAESMERVSHTSGSWAEMATVFAKKILLLSIERVLC
jgi:hypothetical protein